MWGLDSAFLELDKQIIADYYNKAIEWGKEVGVNNKGGTFRRRGLMPVEVGDWIEGDYMSQDSILTIKWQNPRPISHSFAFNRNEEPEDYRTTNELIDEMIDIVSKNGNLLLDVGPRADGTIPDIQRNRLLGIGKWLELNGEAIYGTRPWQHYGEEKVRFTQKQQENVLYAILLEWPGESVTIKTAKDMDIENIHMLGIRSDLTWQINQEGLWIECPENRPCDHAYVLKITLS
jgi:alpha-L-fucosidase